MLPKISIKYLVFSIKGFLVILVFTLYSILNTLYSIPAFAQAPLDSVNRVVCDRFEEDLVRMSAIMDELRRRKGITETRVAFGGYDTPIKQADYQVTFAAEALAYQRAKKYSSSKTLRSDLAVLRSKILRAKTEVGKALSSDK